MSNSHLKTKVWIAAMLAAGVLSGCGGGAGDTSAALDSSISITSSNHLPVAGMVSGLGSIVVNGVRYETIGANVYDADDNHVLNNPLGIGMTVSLETSSNTTSNTANRIHIQSGIQGYAANINATTNTLTVAGLPVTTEASTLIVRSNGTVGSFADLVSGPVEVYGLPQTDGSFKATRIEIETSPSNVQLVGVISQLNTSNGTFTLGSGNNSVSIGYGTSTPSTGLANGVVVAVKTNTTVSASQYNVTQIYVRASTASVFTQYQTNYTGTSGVRNETNELYGMVSGLTPTTTGCSLQVQGLPVSVTSATLCSSLQNGDYVEAKGLLSNGNLAAYRIEFKTTGSERNLGNYADDENDDDHDELKYRRIASGTSSNDSSSSNNSSVTSGTYEIYGTLSNCSPSTCTFTSNGVVMNIDISTAIWEHGTVVTSGVVEAKGYMLSNNVFKAIKMESKNRS